MKIDKINFLGFLNGNTGYSVLSRALVGLMEFLGIDIRIQDLNNQPIQQYQHLQMKDLRDRFQLLHQIPTVMPNADGFYTVTEFDQPTFGSISSLRNAKLVLTESKFCKEVFEEYTKAPVHVVHYPLDPQFKPTGPVLKFNPEVEKFKFKFLSVFEWMARKDPYTLIEAFTEEFSPDEDVCLILRCWSKFRNPKKYIGKIAQGHNVFFMPHEAPHMAPLYRACDAFVTSTLGEGFGHPILEAMACGLLTVVPASTGIMDYCNLKNSMLVPVEEKDFGNRFNEIPHLIKPWFKCWEPNKEMLKQKMRKAVNSKGTFLTQNAIKTAKEFGLDHSLEQLKVAFE